MKERPIVFNTEMVEAILDGKKTQTTRPIKNCSYVLDVGEGECLAIDENEKIIECPYGDVGDRLWVKETWANCNSSEGPCIAYRADSHIITWHDFCEEKAADYGNGPSMNYDKYPGDYTMWWEDLLSGESEHSWKPSTHMPKWAARIWLEVTGVRVERVQDISREDALAEGVNRTNASIYDFSKKRFKNLWISLYSEDSWNRNDWVWVIEFKRIENGIKSKHDLK